MAIENAAKQDNIPLGGVLRAFRYKSTLHLQSLLHSCGCYQKCNLRAGFALSKGQGLLFEKSTLHPAKTLVRVSPCQLCRCFTHPTIAVTAVTL